MKQFNHNGHEFVFFARYSEISSDYICTICKVKIWVIPNRNMSIICDNGLIIKFDISCNEMIIKGIIE